MQVVYFTTPNRGQPKNYINDVFLSVFPQYSKHITSLLLRISTTLQTINMKVAITILAVLATLGAASPIIALKQVCRPEGKQCYKGSCCEGMVCIVSAYTCGCFRMLIQFTSVSFRPRTVSQLQKTIDTCSFHDKRRVQGKVVEQIRVL